MDRMLPVVALALLGALAGCDRLGLQAQQKREAAAFAGIKSLNVTPDGHYILLWDNASGVADITTVTYDIFMDKWDAMPAGLATTEAASLAASGEQGQALSA